MNTRIINHLEMGEFTVRVENPNGTREHYETNLFTEYGISSIYRTGEHVIIDQTGGIFKNCRLGTGIGKLETSSDGLSEGIPLTSTLTEVRLNYFEDRGLDYAQGVFRYSFDGDFEGTIREIMLTEQSINSGMICGKTLVNPIEVKSGDNLTVTYVVNIPIIKFGTLVSETTNEGEPVTLHGGIFHEYADRLVSALPIPSGSSPIGGDLVFVDGERCAEGETEYECNVVHTSTGFSLDMTIRIHPTERFLQVVKFGKTSDGESEGDTRWKVRYGTRVFQPSNLGWNFSFSLSMEVR